MNIRHIENIDNTNVIGRHMNFDSTNSVQSERETMEYIAEEFFRDFDNITSTVTTVDVFYNNGIQRAMAVGYDTYNDVSRLVVILNDNGDNVIGIVTGGMCGNAYHYFGTMPEGLVL